MTFATARVRHETVNSVGDEVTGTESPPTAMWIVAWT